MMDTDTLDMFKQIHEVVEVQQQTIIDLTAALVDLNARVSLLEKGE